MSAVPRPQFVTVADYLRGEEDAEVRHEYSGGRVYAMAGAKTRHNRVAGNAFASLHGKLRGQPCEPFNSHMKVRVLLPRETRFYYPDAMVVCDPDGPDSVFQQRPVVVIEVLSESTRRVDEGEKLEAYLQIPTLRVYLLAESNEPSVTVYRRGDGGFAFDTFAGPDAVLPLPEIGAELALEELYERVSGETD